MADYIKGEKGDPGQDGFSPIITEIDGKVAIQDKDGNTFVIERGAQGEKGERGLKGDKGEKGEKGDPGEDGFSPIITEVNGKPAIQDKDGNVYILGSGSGSSTGGFSPIARVAQTSTGATITITDENGTTTASVKNGSNGANGFTPIISAITDGISIQDENGNVYTITKGADGQNGADGADGTDGFSPIITTVPGGVTIQDKDGTVHTLTNGKDGTATHVELTKADYEALSPVNPAVVYHITDEGYTMFNGVQYGGAGSGAAGYSPIANVTKSGDTATITITDQTGTTAVTVKDGKDGVDGFTPVVTTVSNGVSIQDKSGTIHTVTNGADGADGKDGADGFSPVVTPIENGVTIQDKAGNTYNITNGVEGAEGFSPVVTPIENGVTIQDKAGDIHTITNGKDGKDGILSYTDLASMVAEPEVNLHDGSIAWISAQDRYYQYLSTNEIDGTYGKWRELAIGSKSTYNYSTSEQVVGTWIDGKTIYRKVLTAEVLASDNVPNARLMVNFNINETNISQIISIKGSIKIKADNDYVECGGSYYVGDDPQLSTNMSSDNSKVLFVIKNGAAGIVWFINKDLELIAIVEYTKTTD